MSDTRQSAEMTAAEHAAANAAARAEAAELRVEVLRATVERNQIVFRLTDERDAARAENARLAEEAAFLRGEVTEEEVNRIVTTQNNTAYSAAQWFKDFTRAALTADRAREFVAKETP